MWVFVSVCCMYMGPYQSQMKAPDLCELEF